MNKLFWDKQASDYDNQLKLAQEAYLEVIELIKKEINRSYVLLDVGTGTGDIPIALHNFAERIIATDFSPQMIDIANRKLHNLKLNNLAFQVEDCSNLNFGEEMFDGIIVANLMHFLEEPEQFLKSTKRLLKKDGKIFILSFLFNENIKAKIFAQIRKFQKYPIKKSFNSKSIIDFVAGCGYKVEKSVFIKSKIPMIFIVGAK